MNILQFCTYLFCGGTGFEKIEINDDEKEEGMKVGRSFQVGINHVSHRSESSGEPSSSLLCFLSSFII